MEVWVCSVEPEHDASAVKTTAAFKCMKALVKTKKSAI